MDYGSTPAMVMNCGNEASVLMQLLWQCNYCGNARFVVLYLLFGKRIHQTMGNAHTAAMQTLR